jgi:hypothetical protein
VGVKLKLLRSDNEDLVRFAQIVQLGFDALDQGTEHLASDRAVTVSRDTQIASSTGFVFVDASGGPVTVSLPTTSDQTLTFRSVTNSTNAVRIQAATAAKINGTSPYMTLAPLASLSFRQSPTTKAWFTI